MTYRNIERVGLFQVRNDHQYSYADFTSPPDHEQVALFPPSGTNVYVDFGPMLERVRTGPALLPSHVDPILDIRSNVRNGYISFCLQPKTGDTPLACHELVADNPGALRMLFDELQSLVSEDDGPDIYLRYAGEFNSHGDKSDPYAGSPEGFKKAIRVVHKAREEAAAGARRKVLLTFCPTINPAVGDFDNPHSPLKSIHPYWPEEGRDIFDAYSCTWYARPQPDELDPVRVLDRVFERLRIFAENMGGPFGFDEIGGSMLAEADRQSPTHPRNDEMVSQMLDRVATIRDVEIQFATLFLQGVWGADAALSFIQ